MSFQFTQPAPVVQSQLGKATVSILGKQGLRLSGFGSFHLDEGPEFAWLNIYRTLAGGKELEITREREPSSFEIENGNACVRWSPTAHVPAELSATYSVVEEQSAVDVTFAADMKKDLPAFELFIANYFTPYYRPRFAVADARAHPEGVHWYEKKWYGEDENECWPRDHDALQIFQDGRWLTGFPLNWRIGPSYAHPLMIQQHRHGHAILLMARPEDCIGLSGYCSYHNSQYFHLFGKDVSAGERLETTVRMVLLFEWDDLQAIALELYKAWTDTPV